MLAKSLKYDLRAVYKLFIIFSLTLFGISLIGAFSLRGLALSEEFTVFTLFALGGVILAVSAFSIYSLGVNLVVFYRYYQNFFTDEAYLTFTLPVKRSTLFNSKILCAFIWSAASGFVTLICFLIFMSMTPAVDGSLTLLIPNLFRELFEFYKLLFTELGGWLIIYTVLGILIFALISVFSTLLIFGCVTLGATMVRKYKLLMAILVYYVVNMGISIISYVMSIVLGLTTLGSASVLVDYSALQLEVSVMLGLIAILMFFAVLSVLIYKFCLYRIEKKLNLA